MALESYVKEEKHVKRLGFLLMILVLSLVAAQCGGQQAAAPKAAPTDAPKVAAPTEAPKSAAPPPTIAPAAKPTDAPKVAATNTTAPAAKATEAPKTAGSDLGSAANPIKMAFVPSSDSSKILVSGDKIGKQLEQISGLKFQVSVPTSYAAVVEAMNAGQVDVAWLAPTSYVAAANRYGVELLLTTQRNGSKVYPFSIIVMADSPIKTIQDLKGKRIIGADPLSTSGNLYPRAYLTSQGFDLSKDVQWSYSGGHDRSIIALVNGQADAAVTFGEYKGTPDARDRVKTTIPDVMQKTRVLLNSQDANFLIPNDTVSVRKGLPADLKKKISDALLQLAKTEEGVKELTALYQINGLDVGDPKDYEPIQRAAQAANIDLGQAIAPPPTRPPATPGGGTPGASGTPRP